MHNSVQFIKNRPISFICIVLTIVLVAVNACLLFNKDSEITRSYFVEDYIVADVKNNEQLLEKKAILTPVETYTVTTEAATLSDILVKRGQTIMMNQEIAVYRSDAIQEQQALIQSELTAYTSELAELKSVLANLKSEQAKASSNEIKSSKIDSLIDINIQLDIQEQPTLAAAIASTSKYIAETERQISILTSRMQQIQLNRAETSPINGIIANITHEQGIVTFTIYSNEKLLLSYVTEEEWKELEVGQSAEIDVAKRDEPVEGNVLMKQAIMANYNSSWMNELQKSVTLPESTYYELEIMPFDTFEELPFASIADVAVTVNEAPDSLRVKTSWIQETKVETVVTNEESLEIIETPALDLVDESVLDINDDEPIVNEEIVEENTIMRVYTINADGKIELQPVDLAFEDGKYSVVTAATIEDDAPILTNIPRHEYYRAFFMMPIEKPDWHYMKDMSWKEYLVYIIF